MPLTRRPITIAQRRALELRYDGPIPAQHLVPVIVWPATVAGLHELLIDLAAELDEARQRLMNDGPVHCIQRDMELTRQEIARREEPMQAAAE